MNRADNQNPQSPLPNLDSIDVGEGEVVVLLHGLGSSRRDWAAQVEALSRTHRVIALDLRGHGTSPAAEAGVTIDDLVEDVARSFVARSHEPCHVVGWSLGGLVATRLAAKHPQLVRSLCIVNSPPACRPTNLFEHVLWAKRKVLTRFLSPRALAPIISRGLFPNAEQDVLRREFVERFAANDERSYRAVFDAIADYDCKDVLERVVCPVLVVTGDRDYWPVSAKRAQAARFRNARVAVIEGSGHATPVERPEAFNDVLVAFLARRSERAPSRTRALSTFAAICAVFAVFGCAEGNPSEGEPGGGLEPTVNAPEGSGGAGGAMPDPSAPAPSGSTSTDPAPSASTTGSVPPAPAPSGAPTVAPTSDPPPATGTGGTGGAPPTNPPGDAGSGTPPGTGNASSRCKVTATSVYCDHQVTSFKASATEIRDVYWQTPTTPPPAEGYPVVIVYQGSLFGPSLTWAEMAPSVPFGGFYQGVLQASLLDHGFTVIAPAAAGSLYWQTNTGTPYEMTGDYVFIGALLEAIEKGEFGPADPTHFYATGISSGGYMTSRMAVSYAGVFRALAIESGSYATCLGPICSVPTTLPADHPATLFLHGGADTTVPLATAEPYYGSLHAQGVDTELIVDQSAGHQWLSVAPEKVTEWFSNH